MNSIHLFGVMDMGSHHSIALVWKLIFLIYSNLGTPGFIQKTPDLFHLGISGSFRSAYFQWARHVFINTFIYILMGYKANNSGQVQFSSVDKFTKFLNRYG